MAENGVGRKCRLVAAMPEVIRATADEKELALRSLRLFQQRHDDRTALALRALYEVGGRYRRGM